MPSLTAKLIYQNSIVDFTGYDVTEHSLQQEHEARSRWANEKDQQLFLLIITLGIAYFFLPTMVSKDELEGRISLLRTFSKDMEAKARVIQKAFAKRFYKNQRFVSAKMAPHLEPQFNSRLQTLTNLVGLWYNQGYPNFWSGHRGQIIWDKTKALYQALQNEGYYVFLHAHSYPIALHLELASHLARDHQSEEFKAQKPHESARKFRAPGVGQLFANTKEYLRSHIADAINAGYSMDDNHRDTIISCDAIPENNESYESAQHFFKSNRSIVDTHSSTGMTFKAFDAQFIRTYIQNYHLQQYVIELFAKAREGLSGIADYGMIRIIAIAKETLQNENTNYMWRSHPFGRLCKCRHSVHKFGHSEFVETLKDHQAGSYKLCTKDAFFRTPQYRILARNIDKDITKQVFTMDCLNNDERTNYNIIFESLLRPLSNIQTLQTIPHAKSVEELAEKLRCIDLKETSNEYKTGIHTLLRSHRHIFENEKHALSQLLSVELYSFITSV